MWKRTTCKLESDCDSKGKALFGNGEAKAFIYANILSLKIE
jgi:hypothetical protein